MVKKQKERQYLSASEQRAQGRSRSNLGGETASSRTHGVVQKSLPFQCCALTLVPFETPVCTILRDHEKKTQYGVVFENTALMDFVMEHKVDPIQGSPMGLKQIIRLNMDKDSETQRWQCPVLTKAFSDHTTKIVAIVSPPGGNEANVYSYEAYQELNVKTKNYVDLTTGLKFSPKTDVILLNDPSNPGFQKQVRDVSNFWYIRNARTKGPSKTNNNIRKSVTATRVMEEFHKRQKIQQEETTQKKQRDQAKAKSSFPFEIPGSDLGFSVPTEDVTGVQYTSGHTASGFTSTSSSNASDKTDDLRQATPEEILQARLDVMKSRKGQKGYVRMMVRIQKQDGNSWSQQPSFVLVPLLLELHCDIVPLTSCNFLGLCRQKRYDGTIFHRYIPNFMIQGGGQKGRVLKDDASLPNPEKDASLWGYEGFADEFDDRLKHTSGGGILSMANAGPKTNKQQFFITVGEQPCPHLDRKHSVFGVVAKGMDELQKALEEHIEIDSKDRPCHTGIDREKGEPTKTHGVVQIVATEVLEDPAEAAKIQEDLRLKDLNQKREALSKKRKRLAGVSTTNGKATKAPKKESLGVGKYLSTKTVVATSKDEPILSATTSRPFQSSTLVGLPNIGDIPAPSGTKKKKGKMKFGDFSGW